MNRRIECKDFIITCITPVHIGSGEKLGKTEYMYDPRRQQVSIIDSSKFNQLLLRKGKLDEFAKAIYIPKGFNLYVWLKNNNFSVNEIASISKRLLKVFPAERNINEIDLQARQVDGRLYIPGSTVKGVIRTAIMSQLLKNDAIKRKKYWRILVNNIDNARSSRDLRAISENWENELLEKIPIKTEKAATKNAMRGVLISDAITNARESIILKKLDASYVDGKFNEHGVALFRECIPAGTEFKCRITMDHEFMKLIGLENIADIWQLTRNFYQEGINLQQEVFGRQYHKELSLAKTADMLLGGGSGFISKTVFYTLALTESKQAGTKLLAKYFDKMFQLKDKRTHRRKPAHNHVIKDKIISPRTLKLVPATTGNQLIGLCKIREAEDA